MNPSRQCCWRSCWGSEQRRARRPRMPEIREVDGAAARDPRRRCARVSCCRPRWPRGSARTRRSRSASRGYDGARSRPSAARPPRCASGARSPSGAAPSIRASARRPRPTIGGRVQLLRQERHGIDGSFSVFYRPEGFTEPEGEIESFVSLGRRFERISVFGNLVYGQDPEGNERDGEIRFASLYGVGRWAVGIDSRLRFAIGTQRSAMAMAEPKFDLLAGPVASATVGPVALFAQAGPSVLRVTNSTSVRRRRPRRRRQRVLAPFRRRRAGRPASARGAPARRARSRRRRPRRRRAPAPASPSSSSRGRPGDRPRRRACPRAPRSARRCR